MQRIKKLMVVVPLVLLMVLGSFPVFAEENKDEKKDEKTEAKTEIVEFSGYVKMDMGNGLFKEKSYGVKVDMMKYKDDKGNVNEDSLRSTLTSELKAAFIKDLALADRPDFATAVIEDSLDIKAKTINVYITPKPSEKVYTVTAVLASDPKKVIEEISFKPYEVASSLVNAIEEFKRLAALKLKGLEVVKSDPVDINKDSGSTKAVLYMAPKTKALTVVHIIKGRSPLGEIIMVPSNVVMTERTGIEIAKNRIQAVNGNGYKFERAIYDDGLRRNPLIKEYYGFDGKRFEIKDYEPVLYLYYVPSKLVEAVKAGEGQQPVTSIQGQTPVTGNNQASIVLNPQQPVTANLPSTGVSDYGFLFLSAAAMMAAGIFLAKRK